MPRRRLLALGLALLAALATLVPGCAAPTLPLPPPVALVEGPPDADGMVTVSGNARAGAFVGCLNESTEVGVIVRADVDTGDFSLRIAAEVGDGLTLWQFESTAPGGEQTHVIVPGP
ncbi:MAG TPA: hypothetical protein VIL20_08595 [Sandaracinaceae bacterium]